MHNRTFWSMLTLLIALALLLPVSPAAAQEDTCFEKGGTWDAEAGTCVIQAQIDIQIDYPIAFTEYTFAAEIIDTFLHDAQRSFLGPISEYGFFYSPGPLTLDISYETASFSETVRSLKFTIYDYTGGAHGNTFFQTFVFDTANARELTLQDVFAAGDPLAEVAGFARDQLSATLGDMTDAEWLESGTAPTPENYANWILTSDSLVFFFPPYQVAAYAAGPQTVTIPLSAINDLLDPAFASQG